MVRRTLLALAALALLIAVVGCSGNNDTISSTTGTNETNLNDEFGGYTATPEAPGFGDPELVAAASESADYGDAVLDWPGVDSLVNDANAGRYHLRMLWGQLRLDTTVTSPTDWSGSLTISRGALVIRRVILFEDGQDEVLERTDRNLIEWTSRTTVHHDGLGVDIYVPRPQPIVDTTTNEVIDSLDDTTYVEIIDTIPADYDTVSVTFETGPYSRTLKLSELASLDEIEYIDEDSNAVLLQAVKVEPRGCPKGFLSGAWGTTEEGDGVFNGMWMDQHGYASGYVEGTWGVDDNERNVFFGKWISLDGNFEGFIRGSWRPHPNWHAHENAFAHAGGSFSGKIFADDRTEIGVLRGRYNNHPVFKNGFFQARWKTYCYRTNDDGNSDDMDQDDDDTEDDGIDDDGGF